MTLSAAIDERTLLWEMGALSSGNRDDKIRMLLYRRTH